MKRILFLLFTLFSCLAADDKKEVEKQIDHYFTTWSSKDMKSYKNCFHPDAIIHYKRKNAPNLKTDFLDSFIQGQVDAVNSSGNMKEIPLSKTITLQGDTAHAIVRWELTADNRVSKGYDHFIWTKTRDGWKIIYLYFYFD